MTVESTSFQGVGKIARYNWPWYAAAVLANAAAITLLCCLPTSSLEKAAAGTAIFLGDFWLIASLLVSYYVYDRSPIARAAWLDEAGPLPVAHAAIFHAGEDEASAAVARRYPSSQLSIFDFFDPKKQRAPSLGRARALAAPDKRVTPISQDKVPLDERALDLACVVFAAHEIRNTDDRARFFQEIRRTLRPGARLLVVEHLRDGWNALAYGPGVFHFLPRRAWLATFAAAGLRIERESRCTPFVAVFTLTGAL